MSVHVEKSKTKETSIHTSRTLMFSELENVMAHYQSGMANFDEVLEENVIGKRTKTNKQKTTAYLKRLYGLSIEEPAFLCFTHFWKLANDKERPLLALLYALRNDHLLRESTAVILAISDGDRVTIEGLSDHVQANHPNRFSNNSLRSIAQNIASSWKQAGYITGKVKNIRTQVHPSYLVVTFAMLLSYLNGDRGNYILNSIWVKVLGLHEDQLREMAFEAAKRDLIQYQYTGEVTAISFQNLLNMLDIHGI
jgi:hypothetical protein